MSRSSMDFLTRQRIFIPLSQHLPKLSTCGLKSHYRPFVPARGLIGPDLVVERVLTQKESERPAIHCPQKLPPHEGESC